MADEPTAAGQLIAAAAGLPLALNVIAARAEISPSLPLAVLSASLHDARSRLDALSTDDPATDVRAVLSWSHAQLGAPATRMFRLLGLHAGPDISLPAAARLSGEPHGQARRTLDELVRSHLLTEHVPGRFSCHDLLMAYAAELAGTHELADFMQQQGRWQEWAAIQRIAPEEVAAEIFKFLDVAPAPGIAEECFRTPHEGEGPGDGIARIPRAIKPGPRDEFEPELPR